MDRLLKDLLKGNETLLRKQYENRVLSLIRQRYSQDEENAIKSKKLAEEDNGEFDVFFAYVKECKAQARQELNYNENF